MRHQLRRMNFNASHPEFLPRSHLSSSRKDSRKALLRAAGRAAEAARPAQRKTTDEQPVLGEEARRI